MVRFYGIHCFAVVAFLGLYINQVKAQNGVIVANINYGPHCVKPDSSDCLVQLPTCHGTRCCSGLKYGLAKNGTVWVIESGECTCCSVGKCHRLSSGAVGSTTHTASDAQAFDQICDKAV